MTRRPNSFPKTMHLRGPAVFRGIYDAGVRETAHPLVAIFVGSDLGMMRVGFSVPKKVGNAVVRNRVRRLLREVVRCSKEKHVSGVDVVVLVRPHELKTLAEYDLIWVKIIERVRTRAGKGPLPRVVAVKPKAAAKAKQKTRGK